MATSNLAHSLWYRPRFVILESNLEKMSVTAEMVLKGLKRRSSAYHNLSQIPQAREFVKTEWKLIIWKPLCAPMNASPGNANFQELILFKGHCMRRKRIKHYVDIICKMFVGWRMGDDLELLASLPDGKIDINLIDSTAIHDIIGILDLHVAKEISAWLRQEMKKDNIDSYKIKNASLRVMVNTEKIHTNKYLIVRFEIDCQSKIMTSSTTYEAAHKESHTWHTRKEVVNTEFNENT